MMMTNHSGFDLFPNVGLGDILIGSKIGEVMRTIKQKVSKKKKKKSENVEVKIDEKRVFSHDIVVDVKTSGFYVLLDSISQRVKCIEIYDLKRSRLSYSDMEFSSGAVDGPGTPTFMTIHSLFGPSFPGEYDSDNYILTYPGVAFVFAIPPQFRQEFVNNPSKLPLELPDKTSPKVTRILIYHAKDALNPTVLSLPPLPATSHYFEPVTVIPHVGLEIGSNNNNNNPRNANNNDNNNTKKKLYFGMCPQDVLSEIGAPETLSMKDVDRMRIHHHSRNSKNNNKNENASENESVKNSNNNHHKIVIGDENSKSNNKKDYFYNYYSRGIDIMFDGESHKIKKFVLHTNIITHPEFNQFSKCNFHINKTTINANSLLTDIKSAFLGNSNNSNNSNSNLKPIVYEKNMFGLSYFYGFQEMGLIFEICENNDAIAKLIVF